MAQTQLWMRAQLPKPPEGMVSGELEATCGLAALSQAAEGLKRWALGGQRVGQTNPRLYYVNLDRLVHPLIGGLAL